MEYNWTKNMKTFSAKPNDIEKNWIIVDAEGLVLGRLASIVAIRLRGKHKASFTPHMDMGDNVIIINAKKIQLTGKKRTDKTYYWHTGHPGGIKSRTAEQLLEGKFPERVVTKAVERMLPGGVLSRQQMTNLRVYAGSEHPHDAQNPLVLDVKAMNPKKYSECVKYGRRN
jgi:large subunit ribosomal protein L13